MGKTIVHRTLYHRPATKGLKFTDKSRTKQEFAADADINTILKHYERDGLALPSGDRQPLFGDFSAPELQDYRQALDIVSGAGELMERLPARVRARFGNDVANLLQFVADPKNREEAHELGLLRDDYVSPSAPAAPRATPEGQGEKK